MKPETLKKAQATRKANSEQFASQVIPVGENCRVIRSDELNWKVQQKNKSGQWEV